MTGPEKDFATDTRPGPPDRRHGRYRLLWRPAGQATAAAMVLFGAYEVIEHFWLTGLDDRTLRLVHLVRGMVGAALAATLACWLILRATPPLLIRAGSGEQLIHRIHPDEQQRLTNFARWFIRMRWMAVVVAAVLVFTFVHLTALLPRTTWWPLMITIGILALLNGGYEWLLRRRRVLPGLLLLQAYGDLVILTVLLHFSGGIENPLSLVMLFHVIIGGVVLGRSQCLRVTTVAVVLFALLAVLEWSEVIPHYTLLIFPHFHEAHGHLHHAAHDWNFVVSRVGVQAAVLFLTAYFVTTLAERMRYDEQQLEQMAGRILAERQLLERSLETTGTGLRVVDRNLHCLWVNPQWKRWFGKRADADDSGCVLTDYQGTCEAGDSEVCPALQVLADGQVRVTELTLPVSDPTAPLTASPAEALRTFQVTTAPLLDREGRITQVVELVQDITHQKQVHQQAVRASRLAAVGELAGQVAHEINNPIGILNAKLRLLLSDESQPLSQKVQQEMEKMAALSDRVVGIAKGLLSACRPSTAQRRRMDLRDPIRRALALVSHTMSSHGVTVYDRLATTPVEVEANAGEMEQVFLNLLLNALDAMPEGGRLVLASSELVAEDGRRLVRITVQDNGVGLDASTRERVFEPFFTTKGPDKGTGLGLSICYGLIRSHGGTIELESQPGQGTCVTVCLPAAEPARSREADHG